MKTYLISYDHNGAQWALELKADSVADVRARLAKMPYARVDGELIAKVPAPFGLVAKLGITLRNMLSHGSPTR